jgi:hypothetical protein
MATWTYVLVLDGEPVGAPRTDWNCDLSATEYARHAAALPRPVPSDAVWVWAGEDTAGEPRVRMRRHPRRRALAGAAS